MNRQTSETIGATGGAGTPWYRTLLAPHMRWLAVIVLATSFFLPATGFGVDLCPVHAATGLPCPGCGMTRAVWLASQGDPLSALGANPFVVFVWPLLVALTVLALMPSRAARAVGDRLERHERAATKVYRVLLFAFMGFGALRFAAFLILWERFP